MDYYGYQVYNRNDICHWKYIKKVRRSDGKWRYYYDIKDALGYDERERAANAVRDYELEKRNLDGYRALKTNPYQVKWYDSSKESIMNKRTVEKGHKAAEAIKEYQSTPIGKLENFKDMVDKGRTLISNFLKRLSDEIKPKPKKSITYYSTNYLTK